MSTVYWFKLPTVIKEKIEELKLTLACLDSPDVDAAVADITWNRLPEKLAALVAVTNSKLTTDYTVGNNKWFLLQKEVESYFTFLEGATCSA